MNENRPSKASLILVEGERLRIGSSRTQRFVGREHGASVSYFLVDNAPGEGPALHRHPYVETWIVLEGEARIRVGGEDVHVTAGTTASCAAGVWHAFTNCGSGRLRMLCIHASDEIVQEFFDEAARS
ncbi:MAG: cupin domain-containing protein [Protaetiibacter sp.]